MWYILDGLIECTDSTVRALPWNCYAPARNNTTILGLCDFNLFYSPHMMNTEEYFGLRFCS